MKKLFLLAGFALLFGCSKDTPSAADPNTRPDISAMPARFSQNLLIEYFTQSTCGQCPKADFIIDSLNELHPGRIIPIAIHVNDLLEDTLLRPYGVNQIDSFFNATASYPAGMINRKANTFVDFDINNWYDNSLTTVSQVPPCGLALEAKDVTNGRVNLIVHLGFRGEVAGEYRLHGYIVEETFSRNDTDYAQLNDFSFEGPTPDTTLPFYALNDTIFNYNFRNVCRRSIGDIIEGDIVPQNVMISGNEYIKNFSVDLTGINSSNASIIVFLDKYAPIGSGRRVINAQKVRIGSTQDWN